MDQLVAVISEKTGLSPEMSRKAAETTLDFLKARLPAPIAGQVDAALADGKLDAGDVMKGLGGMFGK